MTKHNRIENFMRDCSQEEFVERYIYLTNKSRGKNNYVSLRLLIKKFTYGGAAAMLKRYDPIAYQMALQDMKP